MSRRIFTSRHYAFDGRGVTSVSINADRHADDQIVRFDFSSEFDTFKMRLPREAVLDLRTMLDEILEDWQ